MHTDICPKHKELFIQTELTVNSWNLTISHTPGQKHCVNIFNQLKGNSRADTSPYNLTIKHHITGSRDYYKWCGVGEAFYFVLKIWKGRTDTIKLEKILQETEWDLAFAYLKCHFFKILYKTEIHWGEKYVLLKPY